MKTCTLNKEEIKAALDAEFMLADLKDFAETLKGFFAEKAQAWMNAYCSGNENEKENVESVYGTETGNTRIEMETAMDDFRRVVGFVEDVDFRVSVCVDELFGRIAVEGEDDDDDADLNMQWRDLMLGYEMEIKGRDGDVLTTRTIMDIIAPYDVMGLCDHAVGIGEHVKEKYRELLQRYDIFNEL